MTSVARTLPAPRPVTPLSILAATLADLTRRLDAVDGVDAGLKAELRQASELARGLDPYLSHCTTPESPALAALAERTAAEDWSAHSGDGQAPPLEQEMLSGHVEGQTLKLLVHATRARRVLDIGMFTGYSALAMAEALPEQGEVVACEVDGYVAEFAQRCFDSSPDGHKISVRVAPALVTLRRLAAAGEPFDLVFIDADKAGYAQYLDVLLETDLLAPHALICVDNTLMQGQPYTAAASTANGGAIAAFNEAVARDDGLTLIRRAST